MNSANFAFTEFSEVRYELATPSNGKDTPFGDVPPVSSRVHCPSYIHWGGGFPYFLPASAKEER
jgi:hypothetical protein